MDTEEETAKKKGEVDPRVMADLKKKRLGEVKHGLALLCKMGPRTRKGQTKAMAMLEAMVEIVDIVFEDGVNVGYNMGLFVGGDK